MAKKKRSPTCPFCGYDATEFIGLCKIPEFSINEPIFKCRACFTVFRQIEARNEELTKTSSKFRFLRARTKRGEQIESKSA